MLTTPGGGGGGGTREGGGGGGVFSLSTTEAGGGGGGINFETDGGEKVSSRFFISCTGVLSVGRPLPFEGVEKFQGE